MPDIIDHPGAITKEEMRKLFEAEVRRHAALRDSTPLGHVTINGAFSHYFNGETDTLWIGFAIGMRRMEAMTRPSVAPDQKPVTLPRPDPLTILGRTEEQWCQEACRIGAYDCVEVVDNKRRIRIFTGEWSAERVQGTIERLAEQIKRFDNRNRDVAQ